MTEHDDGRPFGARRRRKPVLVKARSVVVKIRQSPLVINGNKYPSFIVDYLAYFHRDRTHRGLDQDSPDSRLVESPDQDKIIELPVLEGLHHRYTGRAA